MHKKILLFVLILLLVCNVEAKSCGELNVTNCNHKYDDMGNECGVRSGYCQIIHYNANGFSDMSCKIIDIRSSDHAIAVKFDQANNVRTGYVYEMYTTDEKSSPAFCLDPGKVNNTTYRPVRQLTSSSNWDTWIATTYNWYLNHTDKRDEAQLIMWLIAQNMYNNAPYDREDFLSSVASLIRNYYIGGEKSCSNVESILQSSAYFNNPDFKCSCYYNHGLSGCTEKNWSYCSTEGTLRKKEEKCYEVMDTQFNSALAGLTGSSSAYARETQIASIITQLKSTAAYGAGEDQYRYQLWLFEPDSGTEQYQRIVGLGICKYMGYICEKKYPDYLAGKYGSDLTSTTTIAKFKNDLLDPENVILQSDGTVKCGSGGGTSCNSLLNNNRYMQYSSCTTLKNSVYDPGNVSDCVEQAGRVVYLECGNQPKCDPTVDTSRAVCQLKNGNSSYFSLKDATTENGEVNFACINNNIAYKITADKITSKDEEFSKSKYCDVYCWESLEAQLPQDPAPDGYVQAGRLFFWGLNYYEKKFAEINTRRICWAKNINYNQYKADWNANEDEIAQAYANYQARVAYNNDNDDSHVYESNSKCCKSGYSAGSSSERLCDLNAEPNCRGTGRKYNGIIDICVCSTPESCSGGWGKEYTKKEITGVYVTSVTGNRKEGKSGTASSGCVDSKPSASSLKVSNSDSDLKTKIGNRQRLKTSLMACQSLDMINNNTIYKYTTTMKIKDNDNIKLANVRGVGDFSLTRSDSGNTDISSNVPAGSFATGCTDVGSYNTANPCAVADGTTIPTYANSTFAWDYTGVSKFLYNDNFHFYASADTDYVANKTLQTEKFNYAKADMMGLIYDMGVGIPTNINSYNGQFNIEVEINGLGNNGHFDKIAANKTKYGYDFNKYSCPYQLANVIYDYECGSNCSDRGLDIVYRIIDMPGGKNGIDLKKTVFPGKDGKGRKIGSNWAQFITDRYKTFKNIVTYGIIYDKTPIYSIDLSQTLITEIRRNNKTYSDKKMDPYTSYRDTDNKFKIKCSYNNAEKSCVSTYITTLIKQGKITGRFANPDEEQRINLIHSYKTCYDVDHPNC